MVARGGHRETGFGSRGGGLQGAKSWGRMFLAGSDSGKPRKQGLEMENEQKGDDEVP